MLKLTLAEVIFLLYNDLQDLIRHSYSSRQYFMSLPVSLQTELHKNNNFIRSAYQLHTTAKAIQRNNCYNQLGHW